MNKFIYRSFPFHPGGCCLMLTLIWLLLFKDYVMELDYLEHNQVKIVYLGAVHLYTEEMALDVLHVSCKVRLECCLSKAVKSRKSSLFVMKKFGGHLFFLLKKRSFLFFLNPSIIFYWFSANKVFLAVRGVFCLLGVFQSAAICVYWVSFQSEIWAPSWGLSLHTCTLEQFKPRPNSKPPGTNKNK